MSKKLLLEFEISDRLADDIVEGRYDRLGVVEAVAMLTEYGVSIDCKLSDITIKNYFKCERTETSVGVSDIGDLMSMLGIKD